MQTTRIHTPTTLCRLGVGISDITPPVGMYHRMWGAAKHDCSTGIHRHLQASAVVLKPINAADSQCEYFIALDHCLLRPPEMAELRQSLCEILKVRSEQLTIVFSHTHGSGLLTRDRAHLPGGDMIGPYLDSLPSKVAEAVREAIEFMEPATLTYGSGDCCMGNQRDCRDEAAGLYVCGFNPDIHWDLPVRVIRATDEEGTQIATFVSYPCHPTTLAYENTLVSPDYVGALRTTIEEATHAPCVFFLAPCGDIGPREGYVGDFNVADRNGRQVAYAALQALEAMPPAQHDFAYLGPVISGATLGDWRYQPQTDADKTRAGQFRKHRLTVPLDYLPNQPTIEQIRVTMAELEAQESAARQAGDEPEAARLRALVERQRRLIERTASLPVGGYPYPVDLWQLGDAVWIAVDGEPYYALQSELSRRFPQLTLIVLTLSDGALACYLPTREAYALPLYQVDVALVAPGSLERVIDAIADWLQVEA